ncbi:MAG: RNA methyltransferase, partial [Lentisphaeria bacterium]|nr:RNA methyltransferase [Lentisphaeria bacterium]
ITMDLSRREKALLLALTTRGGRRRSGCCRCEGVRAVRELLTNFPGKVRFIAATERGIEALGTAPDKLRIVPEREFEELSGTVNSQGVIAVADMPEMASGAVQSDFILALDQLGDPGNFGTIARSLRAAGQHELWYTKGSIDPWGDKAIRSGMGVQFALRMRRFDTLEELALAARELGFCNIFIADPHQGESCFKQQGLFEHSVIVIGGEPNGVLGVAPDAARVMIPMPGDYESINAAQAATVLIFESVRRSME